MNHGPLCCALAVLLASHSQPLFRARTDLVRVDALVVDDGQPVTNLRAADFEVKDNGVTQQIAAVRTIADVLVGIVLDLSFSMTGPRLEKASAAARELISELHDGDRFALLAFGDQVAWVADSSSLLGDAAARMRALAPGGQTALLDGAYAGILQSDVGSGPKLLVLMTDGRNNVSWLRAKDVIDSARRHETVIYPVAVGVERQFGTGVRSELAGSDAVALLHVMARETGGRVVEADWRSDLRKVFGAILHEYRQRYILTFTPEGVKTNDGWHRIEVKLKSGKGTVSARKSYWAGK
jgi:VWFA-related protein